MPKKTNPVRKFIHLDNVYMGRGSQNLITCWTPYGDVPMNNAPLAILEKSHILKEFKKIHNSYTKLDVDRDVIKGGFTTDPLELTKKYGGKWRTTSYRAGDILIFGMKIFHGALTSTSSEYRISSDTRYQPADEPFDERWIGDEPEGHKKFRDVSEIKKIEDYKKEMAL